jgi:16S rRNA processing protein RimM
LTRPPDEREGDAANAGAPGGLPAGRVGRAHGLDGSFYVTRPRPRLLQIGVAVTVGDTSTTIVRRSGTEQRPIVRVEGVEDRAAAEALRGVEVTVDGAEAPPLGEGEFWAHELEGCAVLDGERIVGTVARLIELPSCEALEVRPADGGETLLVPMVADAVRRVDPERRRIEVSLDFLGIGGDPGAGADPDGEDRRAGPGTDRRGGGGGA